MHIIISCFVRKRKIEEKEREREGEKRIVLFLAIGEYMPSSSFSFFFGSFENRTEQEKTQLIGGIYIGLKSLPDMFAKGQVKRKRRRRANK